MAGPNQPSQRILKPLDTQGGQPGPMTISLGDAAPVLNNGATVQHLYLGIKEIDVTNAAGQSSVLASYPLPLEVDVTQFQNGNGSSVAAGLVQYQQFSQIRFLIDTGASSIVYGTSTYTRTAPIDFLTGVSTMSSADAGASTSTQWVNPNTVAVTSSEPYSIGGLLPIGGAGSQVHVDFNAFESVAAVGGTIVANPALFVAGDGAMGSIQGEVVDANGSPVSGATVVAVSSNGAVGNTTLTGSDGSFLLHTLTTGTYQLVIYNAYTTASGAKFTSNDATNSASEVAGPGNVTVTAGQTTQVGSISD